MQNILVPGNMWGLKEEWNKREVQNAREQEAGQEQSAVAPTNPTPLGVGAKLMNMGSEVSSTKN